MSSSIEDALVAAVRLLPSEKQSEVLDFASFLASREHAHRMRKPIRGLWEDLGIEISAEEIAAARKEMWQCVEEDKPIR